MFTRITNKINNLKFMTEIYKKLPFLNLVIATSALTFQLTILYPWHNQLSKQLDYINKRIDDIYNKLDKKY